MLDTTADRCIDILDERRTVFDELQRLKSELGLERPWLWWRRRAWERSVVVQERKQLIGSTMETFDSIGRLMAAVEKSQASLRQYMEAEVFETVETYSSYAENRSSKISVGEHLVSGGYCWMLSRADRAMGDRITSLIRWQNFSTLLKSRRRSLEHD